MKAKNSKTKILMGFAKANLNNTNKQMLKKQSNSIISINDQEKGEILESHKQIKSSFLNLGELEKTGMMGTTINDNVHTRGKSSTFKLDPNFLGNINPSLSKDAN